MSGIERRSMPAQIKFVRSGMGDKSTLTGYAAVYNSLSEDLGGFRERLLPGAFDEALRPGADVRALWQHQEWMVLGRTTNGTLRLRSDAFGLQFEIDPPEAQWARDAVASVRRGDVNAMSFGFYVPPGGDEWRTEGKHLVRNVSRVQLKEVSPVTFPAYVATMAHVVGGMAQPGPDAERHRKMAARRRELLLLEMKGRLVGSGR